MMPSTRKRVLFFVTVAALALPLAYFFAWRFVFWLLVALTVLDVAIWFSLAVAQHADTARFGPPMTLDEILREKDPDRMVQLLRYHLGWSPARITGELNRRQIRNYGLPWREDDVRRIVKGVRRTV